MPLDLSGLAHLADITLDREGASEDHGQSIAEYKLRLITDAGVLAYFAPDLKSSLFRPTGEPRFQNMGPVKWKGSQHNVAIQLETLKLPDAHLGRFSFEPLVGDRVLLHFTATTRPTPAEIAATAQLLKTDINIQIGLGDTLPFGDTGTVHQTSAPTPDIKPLKDALANAEIKLTEWPQPDENGIYKPTETLNFKDETLHIDCSARIHLAHIEENVWIHSFEIVYPGDGPDAIPLMKHPHMTHTNRATAIAACVQRVVANADWWISENKRIPAAKRNAVTALKKWATGLLVGGAPASLNEPPKPAKKSSKKKS